jgi:hypothetical protein
MSEISKHPFDVEATPEEIDQFMKTTAVPGASAEFLHDWELTHGYRERDSMNPTVLHEVQKVADAAPSQVSAKLPDGTVFSGSAQEVAAAVGAQLTRNLEAKRQQQQDEPARDSRTGRFTADQGKTDETEALRVAAAAELELKFKRSEITAAEYIRQSGAMDEYLQSRGIDVAAHQAQQQENIKTIHSWTTATAQFKARHTDWPGGEGLMNAMVERMDKLGLTDSPSVESLERAYTALSIESEMAQENDPYKMEALKERWRKEVEGRFSGPQYNQ